LLNLQASRCKKYVRNPISWILIIYIISGWNYKLVYNISYFVEGFMGYFLCIPFFLMNNNKGLVSKTLNVEMKNAKPKFLFLTTLSKSNPNCCQWCYACHCDYSYSPSPFQKSWLTAIVPSSTTQNSVNTTKIPYFHTLNLLFLPSFSTLYASFFLFSPFFKPPHFLAGCFSIIQSHIHTYIP